MSLNPARPARRPRRIPPLLIAAGVLLLLVLGGFAACQVMGGDDEADAYRTSQVERGAISRTVSASGTLEALVTVDVGSQISGQIVEVTADFNDVVRRGQTLAVLDPQTFESRVAQSRADIAAGEASLRQAQADLAAAQADFDRKETLVNQNIYAPATLDVARASLLRARAAVDAARARIAQSQASLRSQQVDLGRTRIVAPIDGVIVDRQIEPGQTVAASLQAPVLFRIAQDLSQVEVKISVDEADIGQVREGQTVRFTVDAFPDDSFEGVVTQVRKQPVIEQNVVAYTVMAEAENPRGRLLPGMTANADILLEERPGVLKVPAAALRWKPPGQAEGAAPRGMGGPPGFGPPGGGRPGGPGGGMGRGGPGRMLVEQLDLDAAQQKRWAEIQGEMRGRMAAAMASSGGDRAAMREQMRKNMEEAIAKLEPSLKPAQKAKLAALRATLLQAGGRGAPGGYTAGVVYVLRDGAPVPVPVQVGATDGGSTEVRGPLKPGDEVITGGGPDGPAEAPRGGMMGGGPRMRMGG